jgi:hypothetical protein
VSDREKVSFSELDKMRREKRRGNRERRPRGEKAEQRSRAAVAAYKRKVEERLFGRGVDAARMRLEDRLREAHGSPAFRSAYKEYVRTYGVPRDVGLLVLLIDLDDEREVLRVLDAIGEGVDDASLAQRNLLRSRLRNLEMSASSDALADAAADLVSRI